MSNPRPTLPVLMLPFKKGYTDFCDLACLIGHHNASLALSRCVGICTQFDAAVLTRASSISESPYLNPNSREGVDILITSLAVEVLKVMKEHHCFDNQNGFAVWEFINVLTGRLCIAPTSAEVAHAHPLICRALECSPTPQKD